VLREAELIVPQRPAHLSEHEQIVADFRHYLREQGGSAPRTIITHLPALRRFLVEHCKHGSRDFSRLDATDIVSFVAHHALHESHVLDTSVFPTLSTVQGFDRDRAGERGSARENVAIRVVATVSDACHVPDSR